MNESPVSKEASPPKSKRCTKKVSTSPSKKAQKGKPSITIKSNKKLTVDDVVDLILVSKEGQKGWKEPIDEIKEKIQDTSETSDASVQQVLQNAKDQVKKAEDWGQEYEGVFGEGKSDGTVGKLQELIL